MGFDESLDLSAYEIFRKMPANGNENMRAHHDRSRPEDHRKFQLFLEGAPTSRYNAQTFEISFATSPALWVAYSREFVGWPPGRARGRVVRGK